MSKARRIVGSLRTFIPALWLTFAFGSVAQAVPVQSISSLQTITFYELTSGPATPYPFARTGPELTTRLNDPLSSTNRDFQGLSNEFYDVFYSNANGTFNANGEYVTIEGTFTGTTGGGGLNLAEMQLNFQGGINEFATVVASFFQAGGNAVVGSEQNAIDGNLGTATTMGNTAGSPPGTRLRITLGFASTIPCVSPPTGMVGWWPLDEKISPTARELVAGGVRNGTHTGPFSAGNFITGVVGGAYRLNSTVGTANYVSVADNPNFDFTASFSIDAWVRIPSSTSTPHYIVSKATGSGFSMTGYQFFIDDGGGTNLHLGFAMGTANLSSNDNLNNPQGAAGLVSLNAWHHVAVVVDRTTNPPKSQLYLDGVAVGAQFVHGNPSLVGSIVNTAALRIGACAFNNCPFAGDIDEVELFRRALTLSEVQGIHGAGPGGKCKVSCKLPAVLSYCPQDVTKTASLTLCNNTNTSQSFTWNASQLPVGGTCNIPGPTSFTPPGQSVTVPPFSCNPPSPPPQTIAIGKPPGLIAGTKACYQVIGSIPNTGTVACSGSVVPQLNDALCCGTVGGPLLDLTVGVTASRAFECTNFTSSAVTLDFRLEEADGTAPPPSFVLSLDGLSPGTASERSVVVPANSSATIPFEVRATDSIGSASRRDVLLLGTLDVPPLGALASFNVEAVTTDPGIDDNGIPALGDVGTATLVGLLLAAGLYLFWRGGRNTVG